MWIWGWPWWLVNCTKLQIQLRLLKDLLSILWTLCFPLMQDPVFSIQANEAGIVIHPLQVWKPVLRAWTCGQQPGVHPSWLWCYHFPFTANPTPKLPGLWSSAEPELVLLAGEITFTGRCYSAWCYFGFTCCSSWLVLFLADFHFPLYK